MAISKMCDITVKTISARLADRFPGPRPILGFLVSSIPPTGSGYRFRRPLSPPFVILHMNFREPFDALAGQPKQPSSSLWRVVHPATCSMDEKKFL